MPPRPPRSVDDGESAVALVSPVRVFTHDKAVAAFGTLVTFGTPRGFSRLPLG